MSTMCGRPQGGGGPAHVDACGQGEGGQKRGFFVDVINGWPLFLPFYAFVIQKLRVFLKNKLSRFSLRIEKSQYRPTWPLFTLRH